MKKGSTYVLINLLGSSWKLILKEYYFIIVIKKMVYRHNFALGFVLFAKTSKRITSLVSFNKVRKKKTVGLYWS